MVRPVASRWPRTQAFRSNPHWAHQLGTGHTGEDIGGPEGTTVVAMNGGWVIFADWGYKMSRKMAARLGFVYGSDGSGIQVCIEHPDGTYSSYSHLSRTDMPGKGEWVNVGVKIGEMGSTGFSFGSHLHGEVTILANVGGFLYGRIDPTTYYNQFPLPKPVAPPVKKYTADEQFFLDLGMSLP